MVKKRYFDKNCLNLYLATDYERFTHDEVCDVVRKALKGGVSVVQLRHKEAKKEELLRCGRDLKRICDEHGVFLFINDAVEVALEVNADGVHLGQGDMGVSKAREMLGDGFLIGLSIEEVGQVKNVGRDVDYIAASPVFKTGTKLDVKKPLGLTGVKKLRSLSNLPLVGIGGIGLENVAEVIQAGCDGVAVVSAIFQADDPEATAREFISIINRDEIIGIR